MDQTPVEASAKPEKSIKIRHELDEVLSEIPSVKFNKSTINNAIKHVKHFESSSVKDRQIIKGIPKNQAKRYLRELYSFYESLSNGL